MNTNSVISLIQNTTAEDIDALYHAITIRYKQLYPDSEFIFLSLPKNDPIERKRILEYTISWLKAYG